MVESLVVRWGYWAVGIGTFFEGETVLIAAGAFAHRGLVSLPWVIVTALVGSIAGDQLWYQIGRRLGRPFVERHRRWRAQVARAEAWLARRGALFVLGFRFVYGIRMVTPMLLGASRYPTLRFVVLNVVGGALWAVLFGVVGWALGASLEAVIGRSTGIEAAILVSIVLGAAVWLVVRRLQQRRRSPSREQAEPEDTRRESASSREPIER